MGDIWVLNVPGSGSCMGDTWGARMGDTWEPNLCDTGKQMGETWGRNGRLMGFFLEWMTHGTTYKRHMGSQNG